MPTSQELKRIERLARAQTPLGVAKELDKLETKFDETAEKLMEKDQKLEYNIENLQGMNTTIDKMSDTLDEVKEAVTHKEDTGEIVIKIDPQKIKGKDGRDGIGRDGKDGRNGVDGKTPTRQELLSLITPLIPKPPKSEDIALLASKLTQDKLKPLIPTIEAIEADIPKLGEKIRDSLELLQDDNRLSISAIHKLEERLDNLEKRPISRGGGFSKIAMDSHIIDDETPSGTVNGVNTIFTLASVPNPTGSLKLYVNGQRMKITEDYTLSGGTITFITAPPTDSILLADYRT